MQPKELVVAAPVATFWQAERDAIEAAVFVAVFVGAPAVVAVGAVLFMFALTWLVLVAPLVALALTWAAWRSNRSAGGEGRRGEDHRQP
jgi:membrane protein implicated in regulation of membrane protease activity